MTYFQLRVNGNNLPENYADLQIAARAYLTAVDTLVTGHFTNTKLELFKIDGPPQRESALVATVIDATGTDITKLMHLKFIDGRYVILPLDMTNEMISDLTMFRSLFCKSVQRFSARKG